MERTTGPMGPMIHPQAQSLSLGSVIEDRRGLSGSIPETLGAIGISVLLLGGTVFGVIAGLNFAGDSATKAGVRGIATGQMAYQIEHGSYASLEELTEGDSRYVEALSEDFQLNRSEDGTAFCASGTSPAADSKTYWIMSGDGEQLHTTRPAGELCPTV